MGNTKRDWRRILRNMGLTVLGSLIVAFGTAIFILPFELVVGGMSGMAIILDEIIPFAFFTVERIVTVLTWLIYLIGLLLLGRDFALKTLISAIVYPIGISLFMQLSHPDVLGGFFALANGTHDQISLLLAAVFGGVCIGAGCAITFLGGGSTGGTDIIAFSICRFFPRLKSSAVIFCIDALIIMLGMFVLQNLALSLLGITSAFVSAVVVDKVFLGSSSALVAEIISNEHEAINRSVIEKMHRTTHITDTTGGYTGQGQKKIAVCFTMREYADLLGIVKREDKYAFMTVHRAYEVSGEGWTRDKEI